MSILPAIVARPEGLHRPETPPNRVIAPGVVFRRSDGRWEIYGWHFTGPWPHHCIDRGVHLYFGHTLEELLGVANALEGKSAR